MRYENEKAGIQDLVITNVDTVADLKSILELLPDSASVYCLGSNSFVMYGNNFITFDDNIDSLMGCCEGWSNSDS